MVPLYVTATKRPPPPGYTGKIFFRSGSTRRIPGGAVIAVHDRAAASDRDEATGAPGYRFKPLFRGGVASLGPAIAAGAVHHRAAASDRDEAAAARGYIKEVGQDLSTGVPTRVQAASPSPYTIVLLSPTATKRPPPQVTAISHSSVAVALASVQVVPSGLDTIVPPSPTAINRVPPQATPKKPQ